MSIQEEKILSSNHGSAQSITPKLESVVILYKSEKKILPLLGPNKRLDALLQSLRCI